MRVQKRGILLIVLILLIILATNVSAQIKYPNGTNADITEYGFCLASRFTGQYPLHYWFETSTLSETDCAIVDNFWTWGSGFISNNQIGDSKVTNAPFLPQSALKPPGCAYKIANTLTTSISPYCDCDGTIVKISDANEEICAVNNRECNNLTCADWKLQGEYRIGTEYGRSKDIPSSTRYHLLWPEKTMDRANNLLTGRYYAGFWFYIDEELPVLKINGQVDDEVTFQLYQLSADATLNLLSEKTEKCGSECGNSDKRGFNLGLSSNMNPGWYYFQYNVYDSGGEDQFWANFVDKSGNKIDIKNVFTINSWGPIPLDGDTTKEACEEDPSGRIANWNDPWPQNALNPEKYQCCGDDEHDKWTVIGNQYCDGQAWMPLENTCSWADEPLKTNLNSIVAGLPEYNKDALNGSDACCGDDIGNDEGYITSDNSYACFEDNSNYNWYNAENIMQDNQYKIFYAHNTEYISNGKEWYYCDANGLKNYGSENNIQESQTFKGAYANGQHSCTDVLGVLLKDQSVLVQNCNNESKEDCEEQYSDTENAAFCFSDNKDEFLSFDASAAIDSNDGFTTKCGDGCHVRFGENNNFESLNDFSDTSESSLIPESGSWKDFCVNSGINLPICGQSIKGSYGSSYMEQACINSESPSTCMTEYVDESNSCNDIILALEQTPHSDRICSTSKENPDFCNGGYLVQSTDKGNTEYQCCVGENAYCEEYTSDRCEEQGYDLRKEGQEDAECIGVRIGETDCCMGYWSSNFEDFLVESNINNSFICYQRNGLNLIQECCDPDSGYCYNKDTNIPDKLEGDGVYSYGGVPLQVINSFDSQYKQKILSRSQSNSGSVSFKKNQLYITNWKGFEYIAFDLVTNSNNFDQFIIRDQNDKTSVYNLKEYYQTKKEYLKSNRIKIPLNSTEINLSDIKEIEFKVSKGTTNKLLIDNIHLIDENGANTGTEYCAGPFKQWVENLDGPTDEGFLARTNDEIDFTEFGPYEYACKLQGPFDWTGSACCGDDTTNEENDGEFFLDKKGFCWNGTYVLTDQSLAENKGGEVTPLEKSLLFYDNELVLCNTSVSELYNIKLKLNKSDSDESFTKYWEEVSEVTPFTVRGSWICDAGGSWTRIRDYNRLKPIISTFNEIANSDHTILCGSINEVQNYFPEIENETILEMTKDACLMQFNNPENIAQTKIYLGLIMNYSTKTDTYMENVLTLFNPTRNYTINCSDASQNPSSEEFFKKCVVETWDKENPELNVYINKPFKIMIISTVKLSGDMVSNGETFEFLSDFWTGIETFFGNLFGTNKIYSLQNDLGTDQNIINYYKTVIGNKVIKAIKQRDGGKQKIRVDYINLATDVSILKDAMQQKYLTIDDFRATYVSGHFNQTIFVEYPVSSDAQVDWKEITSKLRLKRGEYPQKDFGLVVCNDLKLGYGEECEKLSDETTIFSGGSNSCSEYKPLIYGSGNIMCNTTTCKIDNSSCESLPTCTDEKQNQDETDKDCGGSKCSACNNGLNCTLNTDCQSGYCNSSSKKCANEPVPVNLCGNSQINTETEECDDGNQDDGDGCSSKCKKEYKSIIQDNVQPQCYQTADYECSQFNSDSDKCTELDRCTFSNGVPPSSQDSCSPKSNIECTSILNEQTCKSNTYCSWGIPKCSLNPTYCSTITSEAECNLYSFCDYLTDSNRCALAEYPTHQDNCVGASFPKGNSMCLENLCVWVDDYLLL